MNAAGACGRTLVVFDQHPAECKLTPFHAAVLAFRMVLCVLQGCSVSRSFLLYELYVVIHIPKCGLHGIVEGSDLSPILPCEALGVAPLLECPLGPACHHAGFAAADDPDCFPRVYEIFPGVIRRIESPDVLVTV